MTDSERERSTLGRLAKPEKPVPKDVLAAAGALLDSIRADMFQIYAYSLIPIPVEWAGEMPERIIPVATRSALSIRRLQRMLNIDPKKIGVLQLRDVQSNSSPQFCDNHQQSINALIHADVERILVGLAEGSNWGTSAGSFSILGIDTWNNQGVQTRVNIFRIDIYWLSEGSQVAVKRIREIEQSLS